MPFVEELGAFAGVEDPVVLECFVGGLDGGIDVFDGIVRAAGPDFVGAGVDDVETLAGFCLDPFAVDIGLLFKQVRVL